MNTTPPPFRGVRFPDQSNQTVPPPYKGVTAGHPVDPLTIILLQDNTELARFDLGETPLVLGQSDDCDVCIPDPSISGHHAQLTLNGGAVYISDLGSTNGTTVNGGLVTGKHQLADGDTLRLGDWRIDLHIEQKTPRFAVPVNPAGSENVPPHTREPANSADSPIKNPPRSFIPLVVLLAAVLPLILLFLWLNTHFSNDRTYLIKIVNAECMRNAYRAPIVRDDLGRLCERSVANEQTPALQNLTLWLKKELDDHIAPTEKRVDPEFTTTTERKKLHRTAMSDACQMVHDLLSTDLTCRVVIVGVNTRPGYAPEPTKDVVVETALLQQHTNVVQYFYSTYFADDRLLVLTVAGGRTTSDRSTWDYRLHPLTQWCDDLIVPNVTPDEAKKCKYQNLFGTQTTVDAPEIHISVNCQSEGFDVAAHFVFPIRQHTLSYADRVYDLIQAQAEFTNYGASGGYGVGFAGNPGPTWMRPAPITQSTTTLQQLSAGQAGGAARQPAAPQPAAAPTPTASGATGKAGNSTE